MLRELHLQPGTTLVVLPMRDRVILVRRPDSAADELAGSVRDVYGDAREYVEVEAERETWT